MSGKSERDAEIRKIKWRIWALRQDNLRLSEDINTSIAREDNARRDALIMQSRFPGTPDFDPAPWEKFRAYIRQQIAETEAEITGLLAQLEELEKGGADA